MRPPQIRTFARLLGLPEPPPAPGAEDDPLARGPLPASAVEFYLSLVNRCGGRAAACMQGDGHVRRAAAAVGMRR